ncbi:MAG: BCCT family transporter [Actinomycetaceae bacterium]|nr:BCCT family transporter [Actinomycetaceae bacterium]
MGSLFDSLRSSNNNEDAQAPTENGATKSTKDATDGFDAADLRRRSDGEVAEDQDSTPGERETSAAAQGGTELGEVKVGASTLAPQTDAAEVSADSEATAALAEAGVAADAEYAELSEAEVAQALAVAVDDPVATQNLTGTTTPAEAAEAGNLSLDESPQKRNALAAVDPSVAPAAGTARVSRGVFYPAAALLLVLVVAAIVIPGAFQNVIATMSSAVSTSLSWYYVLAATGFVGFVIFAAFSRFGDIKLGDDDDEPEYSLGSWFAMLFAAGMGIGLVFYGAGEPLSHFASPRPGVGDAPAAEIARQAMASTFLHWGFHAWSIYVVVGLAIAYAHFRRKRTISIRWTLEPLLGKKRVKGGFGDLIDVVAIVGTVLGVATSLGFGVYQVSAGIEYLTGFKSSNTLLVVLVIVISALAATSVATGLDNGIKFLSNLNLVMAAFLALAVMLLGPTVFILNEFVQDIGMYLSRFVELAFQTLPFQGVEGNTWLTSWTTNYWGWWISWSPFVGIFIARISRGRTIREFIVGVMAVPTLVTFLWFAIMGGNALYQELFTPIELIGAQGVNINTVLFQSFEILPFGQILSGLAMIVVIIFFITSSDSGSFVLSMLSTGGDPNPALYVRLTWATLVGAITAAILGTSTSDAGMAALQSLAILAALPFSAVMIGMCVSLLRSVRREHARMEAREQKLRRALLVEDVSASVVEELGIGTFPQSSAPRRRSPIPVAPEIADFIRRRRSRGRKGKN